MQSAASPLDPHPGHRPTGIRWQVYGVLMGFAALNHFHRQSLPAVVTQVMADCGFSPENMSWIYSSFLLGYVVCMIGGGWIADRRGGSFGLILSGFGTAAMVAATGVCGLIPVPALALGAFLVVRCLMGALTTPLFPAAGRILRVWTPFRSAGVVNGAVLGATTIGVSLAPLAFGALSDRVGWQGACGVMGVLTALLTAAWMRIGRNSPAEHPGVNDAERELIGGAPRSSTRQVTLHDFLTLLRDRNLLLLTLNYGAVGYYEYTLFYWIKYYFSEVLHYDEQTSRNFTAIVSFAMFFAMPLGGILSDRLVRAWGYRAGRGVVPIVGMLASAGLLFGATHVTDWRAVVALFFLAHGAIGLCEAPIWVTGLEIGGQACATAASIVNAGGNLGGLIAPVITIYVAEAYGWNAGFLVASGACLLGVLLWLGIRLEPPSATPT